MRTILAPALFAVALAAAPATAQTVDFSLTPDKGLKFKLTRTTNVSGTARMTVGEEEHERKQEGSIKEVFTQTYLEVTEGKVRKIERAYEEMTSSMKRTGTDGDPRTDEQESMLEWKTFRGEWNEDDKFTLTMKDDETFDEAEEKFRKRLNAKRLLMPVVTLPSKKKKVGESWKIDPKATILDLMAVPTERDSEQGGTPDFDGEGSITFSGVTKHKEMECAVLQLELDAESEMRGRPGPSFTMKGTAYYSLKHRIVVGFAGKATIKMESENRSGGFELKTKTSVKFVKKDDDADR